MESGAQDFNPLKYAHSTESCLQNHETHHCSIIVLTLFGNMGLLNCPDRELQDYQSCIFESVESASSIESFAAVKKLLDDSNDALDHFHFSINHKFTVSLNLLEHL